MGVDYKMPIGTVKNKHYTSFSINRLVWQGYFSLEVSISLCVIMYQLQVNCQGAYFVKRSANKMSIVNKCVISIPVELLFDK